MSITSESLTGVKLYEWQENLLKQLRENPDDRSVFWYWSHEGGVGKSMFIKSYCRTHDDALLVSGDTVSGDTDVKYRISKCIRSGKDLRIVFYDVPRTMKSYVNYAALEDIKNAFFYSRKTGMVIFNYVHLVVFANFEPDYTAMGSDRWKVTNVT